MQENVLLILAVRNSTSYNRLPEEQMLYYVVEVIPCVVLKEKLNQK